ncbi:Pentatricopeptide repeat-containing protein [Glycine soja]
MLCTLGRARKWDLVESLWTEMNAKGVAPVNSTYGTLIDAYSKCGLKEEALAWLQTMQSQGMEPDEVTMGIVVLLYKRAREFQKAQEFFRRWIRGAPFRLGMDDKLVSHTNVCLSSHTYATFIDTYGKGGQFRATYETFARIIRQGRSLNTVSLNTMIHLYGNCGQLRQACLLFQKMGKFRCVPDTWTMKEAFLEADVVSYRTLLYAYLTRKMVREAEELIREMDERDLEIDEFTQSALTRMYVESDKCSYSSLIHILASADKPHIAKSYLKKMQEAGLG